MTDCSTNIAGFNYDILTPKLREKTQQQAQVIHGLLKTTTEGLIEIGRRLIEVKVTMSNRKQFDAWVLAEFRFRINMSNSLMKAAKRFGDLDCLDHFQHTALFELSKQRTDERAVSAAIQEARSGQIVTRKRAIELSNRFAETPRNMTKPDALHRLNSSMTLLTNSMDALLKSADPGEINELADQLLSLVMQLRSACRAGTAEEPRNNGQGTDRNVSRQTATVIS